MVIVTKNQYLLASKIHHVTMDEHIGYVDAKINGRFTSVRQIYYTIHIVYSSDGSNSNGLRNSDDYRECDVTIRKAVDAHKVFQNLIQQIREQMPDQLFLDKALERMISSVDIDSLKDQDNDPFGDNDNLPLQKGKSNDRRAKKIRKLGKTKRTNKKVLRRAK